MHVQVAVGRDGRAIDPDGAVVCRALTLLRNHATKIHNHATKITTQLYFPCSKPGRNQVAVGRDGGPLDPDGARVCRALTLLHTHASYYTNGLLQGNHIMFVAWQLSSALTQNTCATRAGGCRS